MHLVERTENLNQLLDAFAEFSRGHGGTAVITGTVGAGKTALVDAFVERTVAAGAHVVRATGARAERELPLGLLHQLASSGGRSSLITPARLTALRQALDAGSTALAGAALEADTVFGGSAWYMQEVCAQLRELATAGPLVMVIEDVQHADAPSLHGLLYLARRLRSEPIMLVLTAWSQPRPVVPQFYAELLRQPRTVRVRLGALSPAGVERLLAQRLGAARAARLADRVHQATGGSPALARALVEDQPADFAADFLAGPPAAACGGAPDGEAGREADDELIVGEAFAQAVIGCLYRGEPRERDAARAAAVLGPEATPGAVARLLGVEPRSAELAMLTLDRLGLLTGSGYRHPQARAAVLEELPEERRVDLHLRSAELLHRQGALPSTVAGHLIAAGRAPGPWAIEVLGETAARACEAGQNRLAIDCLSLALDSVVDPVQRAQLTAALAAAEWAVSPATAGRHLPVLVHALREGQLDGREATATAWLLLWYGNLDTAVEAFNLVVGSVNSGHAAELRTLREWLCFAFPTLPASLAGLPPDEPTPAAAAEAASVHREQRAATALATVQRGDRDEHSVHYAEQVLQSSDRVSCPVLAALLALICAGRLSAAAPWCDKLIERVASQQAPTWRAMLLALRAEIAVNTGDLAVAEARARAALDEIGPDGWGVLLALPVANLVLALTATGQHEEAAARLAMPKPAAIFESRYGLRYIYARGRHYLAIGHLQAAMADFLACGELMRNYRLDQPWIAPWRLGAAEAALRLGDPERCRRFAQEQLELAGRSDPRTAGIALRLLAATGGTQERRSLLRESVQLLESCDDQLELAKSLGDLSDLYQAIGAPGKARLLARRAIRVAGAWGICMVTAPLAVADAGLEPDATTLKSVIAREAADRKPATRRPASLGATCEPVACEPVSRETVSRETVSREAVSRESVSREAVSRESGQVAVLSDAERRVGSLAARGYSNREIAQRLYITVSTVEQHLTRIYRKLRITGRAELPVSL